MNFAHIKYMQYPYNEYYSALRKIALIAIVQALRSSQQFLVMSGLVILGRTATKQRINCLAQGQNTVTC